LTRGFEYRLLFRWRDPHVSEVVGQIRWPILGGLLNQGNLIVERFLASFLPPGIVSAIVYARRVFRAADSILLGGITTAFLPRLSMQYAQGRLESFKKSVVLSLKLSAFIAIPLTVALIVLSEPIIRLLFQRGAFDAETARVTAQLFGLYVLAVLPAAMHRIFISGHYAMFDTKTPFIMLTISLVLSTVFYLALFFAFQATGLALTVPITRLIVALLLAYSLFRRTGSINMVPMYKLVAKISLASLSMGFLLSVLQTSDVGILNQPGLLERMLRLGIISLLGLISFALMLVVLRVQETEQALEILRLRLRRSPSE